MAADLRKRFASLRRATSFVDWRKQKALVKDLEGLLRMIEDTVAPHDPDDAFELLWSFLQLAPSIHERTDDSNGAIGDVMREAVEIIAKVSPRISMDRVTLAERILDAVADAGYGEFDGIIPATADALGDEGLEHLQTITDNLGRGAADEQELEAYRGYGLSSSAEDSVRRNKQLTRSIILADVADAQGDVDAYMARYSAEQLTYGTIAPDVARRLLDAGRVDEAFDIITRARAAEEAKSFRMFHHGLDEVYEECLETQGKMEELKAHLWDRFEQTLSASSLRRYLKLLPDFDDIEAEEKALDIAEAYPHPGAAISFLVDWPAHDRAARVVISRADELDGNSYHTLTTAADALEAEHPLAATLMRRAMIGDTLMARNPSATAMPRATSPNARRPMRRSVIMAPFRPTPVSWKSSNRNMDGNTGSGSWSAGNGRPIAAVRCVAGTWPFSGLPGHHGGQGISASSVVNPILGSVLRLKRPVGPPIRGCLSEKWKRIYAQQAVAARREEMCSMFR